MRKRYAILLLIMSGLVVGGCGSSAERAQKNAFKAQGAVANERLELVDEYMDCVSMAGSDEAKIEACDSYLKAAEALK